MIIIITAVALVVGLCLLFLTIVTPWLAFDWWLHYFESGEAISTGLKNAIGMTLTAGLIFWVDMKIGRFSLKLLRDARKG